MAPSTVSLMERMGYEDAREYRPRLHGSREYNRGYDRGWATLTDSERELIEERSQNRWA